MPGWFLKSFTILLAGVMQAEPIVELHAHIFGIPLLESYSLKLFDNTFEYLTH